MTPVTLWLSSFGSVKGNDAPLLCLANIHFGKSPVIREFFPVDGARPLEAATNYRRVTVYTNANIRSSITQKFHATRPSEAESVSFCHDRHSWDVHLKVVRPQLLQSICVPTFVRLVPDLFQLVQFAGVGICGPRSTYGSQ